MDPVRCLEVLPPIEALDRSDDIEVQTRAVLSLLFSTKPAKTSALSADPSRCANCGSPDVTDRTPYCSCECKEESAIVRQLRSAMGGEAITDPERQAALGQKLWRLLGGGYPRRLALVRPRVIQQVIARNEGKCEGCGAPAVSVDHPGSG